MAEGTAGPTIDMTTKGFGVDGPLSVTEFAAGRPGLFEGPFVWPVMVVDREALSHNIALHADFCSSRGVRLAPHGKTTMAPAIIGAQLEAGAWGMTAATIGQVRAYRSFGVNRILLANELVDPRGVEWVLREREIHPQFEFWCYVDSVAGVGILDAALARRGASRPLDVLLEVGMTGGRTGVRKVATALEVGRAVSMVDGLRLAGVSTYEGIAAGDSAEERVAVVKRLALTVRQTTAALWEAQLLSADRPILVSAGGSAYFDVVVDELGGQWLKGAEIVCVVRSGSYVTHDDGIYGEITGYRRLSRDGGLRPALQLWAQVLSQPEEGLALVGFGRRDAPHDAGLPVPLSIKKADLPVEKLDGCAVIQLDDQHAYMRISPSAAAVEPGDVIGFGISHPCTAFDKWRMLPVVDGAFRVVDCIETHF